MPGGQRDLPLLGIQIGQDGLRTLRGMLRRVRSARPAIQAGHSARGTLRKVRSARLAVQASCRAARSRAARGLRTSGLRARGLPLPLALLHRLSDPSALTAGAGQRPHPPEAILSHPTDVSRPWPGSARALAALVQFSREGLAEREKSRCRSS